eukprot:gene7416-8675_t
MNQAINNTTTSLDITSLTIQQYIAHNFNIELTPSYISQMMKRNNISLLRRPKGLPTTSPKPPVSRSRGKRAKHSITTYIELSFRIDFPPFTCNGERSIQLGPLKRCNSDSDYQNDNLGKLMFGDSDSEWGHAIVNSINEDYFTCTVNIRHEYSDLREWESTKEYTAKFKGSERISNLNNNNDKDYFLTTKVTIKKKGFNLPPVSNTLPVIYVTQGQTNEFQILASDKDTPINNLIFSLASNTIMGGGNSQTQPDGLSINGTGMIKFNPNQPGYFCCQVMISDGANWMVVDFLLFSAPGQPKSAPYFISPTPSEGTTIYCDPFMPSVWMYRGRTDNVGISVVINVAWAPIGVLRKEPTYTQNNQEASINNTWTPKVDDVGSYVVVLGLQDTSNPSIPMIGQRSFNIIVRYIGELCDQSISVRCKSTTQSTLISSSTASSGYIQPTSSEIYMTSTPFTYSIAVSMPKSLNMFDIYLLVEVKTFDYLYRIDNMKFIYQNIESLFNKFSAYGGEGGKFGFGVYSHRENGGINFISHSSIGMPIKDIMKEAMSQSGYSEYSSHNVFTTLEEAANEIVWREGSHRTIAMLGYYDADDSDSALETFNSLKKQSIMPLFVSMSGSLSKNIDNTFKDNFGFYDTAVFKKEKGDNTRCDWVDRVYNLFIKATKTESLKTFIIEDTNSFVTGGLTATYQTDPGSQNVLGSIKVNLKLPAPVPTSLTSSITLSVIGFGKTVINTLYNHPPSVIASAKFNMLEDTPTVFYLSNYLSDIDLNILAISFPVTTFAGIGAISLGDGSPCVANTQYSSTQSFKFIPTLDYSGTISVEYSVSDGCAVTQSTLSFNVKPVNDRPTCNVISSTTSDITLNGNDVDDVQANLKVSLGSVGTHGNLVVLSSNIPAQPYPTSYPVSTKFLYTVDGFNDVTDSFTYTVKDSNGAVSDPCSVTLNIKHVNVAPTVSAQSLTVKPNTQSIIKLNANDYDSTRVTFKLTSIKHRPVGQTDGKFVLCSSPNNELVGNPEKEVDLIANYASISDFCYMSPVSSVTVGSKYASLTFTATDDLLAVSNSFTVDVSVNGDRDNQPPVATPVALITLDQDTVSKSFVLTGTDADDLDKNNLKSYFSKPAKGSLELSSGTKVTTYPSTGNAPLTLKYRPNAGFVGTDTFTFYVVDTLGAASTPLTVTFSVLHVNHPPTISLSPYVFTQKLYPTNQVTPADIDIIGSSDVVTCKVLTLPTTGQLTNEMGTVLAVGSTITKYKSKEPTPSPRTAYNTKFSVNCCDKLNLCAQATGDINYTYENQPPKADSSNVVTDQAVDKTFTFIVDDETVSTVKIMLLKLPVNGVFKYLDGTVITAFENVLFSQTLIYSPDPKLSNTNTPGGEGPLDQVPFYSVDENGVQSTSSAMVSFSVTPKPPPVFEGNTEENTWEDTPLTFTLKAHAADFSNDIEVTVTDISGPSQGILHQRVCFEGAHDCMRQVNAGDVLATIERFELLYTPPKDQFGLKFFNFTFVMKSFDVMSPPINITINVEPINDPPEFHIISPEQYFGMPMNSTQVIQWSATDIDNDIYTLACQASILPRRGAIYEYNPDNAKGGFIGAQITNDSHAFPSFNESMPYWTVVFVPIAGTSGQSYTSFGFFIDDNSGGLSPVNRYVPDVSPINLPPIIEATQDNWLVSVQQQLIITGVTIDDPDSRNNNISMTVSIYNELNQLQLDTSIQLSGEYSSSCVETNSTITCTNNKAKLNYYLAQITTSIKQSGKFYVRVFVDDLGYNSLPSLRASSHLNATKDLTVVVSSEGYKKTNNNTMLSAVIASVAVVAGAAAIGLWRFMKKRAPPTYAFFGDAPFADAAIASNPLYEEAGNGGDNPLYQSSPNLADQMPKEDAV